MNVNRINDDNDELTNEKQRMCHYFLVGNTMLYAFHKTSHNK